MFCSSFVNVCMCSHANFVENVPFTLLLLAIVELQNAVPLLLVQSLACAFTLGRILHGYSFSEVHDGKKYVIGGVHARFRRSGMTLTLAVQAALSGIAVYSGITSLLNNNGSDI